MYEIQRDITQARLDNDTAILADVELRIAQRLALALEKELE